MRKQTVYKVSGEFTTKPENLPEGLTVEEAEVDAQESIEVGAFHFADSAMKENGVYIREDVTMFNGRHMTKEETRTIRDFLNKVLGETSPILRVLVDDVRDVWFEFEPDVWTQGNDLGDTNPNPWERAQNRHRNEGDGLSRRSLKDISESYGPVKFIENTWR